MNKQYPDEIKQEAVHQVVEKGYSYLMFQSV
jgi:transposase-like protein